jgi:CheY-like chemotaxis protein
VKQLVTNQNGHISVTSTVGVGSVFTFSLSYLKTKSSAEAHIELFDLDPEVNNINVLVVEDIPLNQLLMKTLLDEFGFERDIASNGKIAIEMLKNKTYDIILMDLQMPEMNGFETTDYIRKTLHSNVPIIALTADVTTVDLMKCKSIGMNDYIAKPVDDKLLYSKIVGLVKKTSTEGTTLPEKISASAASKYVNLGYLDKRTKSNPTLMMEMISLYLEQTPTLLSTMKESLQNEDWSSLHSAVHKMIPSFLIMGINSDFESKAKKIQEYAVAKQQIDGIQELVNEIEFVCTEACKELEIEYNRIRELKK